MIFMVSYHPYSSTISNGFYGSRYQMVCYLRSFEVKKYFLIWYMDVYDQNRVQVCLRKFYRGREIISQLWTWVDRTSDRTRVSAYEQIAPWRPHVHKFSPMHSCGQKFRLPQTFQHWTIHWPVHLGTFFPWLYPHPQEASSRKPAQLPASPHCASPVSGLYVEHMSEKCFIIAVVPRD